MHYAEQHEAYRRFYAPPVCNKQRAHIAKRGQLLQRAGRSICHYGYGQDYFVRGKAQHERYKYRPIQPEYPRERVKEVHRRRKYRLPSYAYI